MWYLSRMEEAARNWINRTDQSDGGCREGVSQATQLINCLAIDGPCLRPTGRDVE